MLSFLLILSTFLLAQNPIIPNKGANDPHIRIFDGKAYLSASHDKSATNSKFIMEDWWLWSSEDLVNWELESVLKPEDTYIGKPFSSCWATDIAKRNGKYYWYFSEGNQQAGVVVADSPKGPWKDPLGKPLLTSEMTPTDEYDMGLIQDEEGEYYIVFGVWEYYIAKLNEDMISLAEKPRKIEINNPRGPYNLDGKNTEKPTDDKPFMHERDGKYYLSWGCFYAVSDNLYGPYDYQGAILESSSFQNGLERPTWPTGPLQGRHGSFFEWKNQTYFAYCDISQTGNRYFRDTFISYVHYRENGEIAPIRLDLVGVGNYDADKGAIEAEDYYASQGMIKKETANGGFIMSDVDDGDFLIYPNIKGTAGKTKITLDLKASEKCRIEIRDGSADGELLTQTKVKPVKGSKNTRVRIDLPSTAVVNLCFVFRGKGKDLMELDSFIFN
ncbi:MAG: family 43 glycosylhydrolase [Cyclobacteriaceae bacterium]